MPQTTHGLLDSLKLFGKVVNEGLLNPNKYNAPAANSFKDSALGFLNVVPGVGDVASGAQAVDYYNRGDRLNAGLAAIGALPFIPNFAGTFIGKGAKTWDALRAAEAEKMLASGADPREVWKQTGTFSGVDKKLRQEISDDTASLGGLRPAGKSNEISSSGDLQNAMFHPDLYAAYPEMRNIQSSITQGRDIPQRGSFSAGVADYGPLFPQLTAQGSDALSPVLHETQHAVQRNEGFAQGGNPAKMNDILSMSSPFPGMYSAQELNDAYRRMAGEVEARLTQARMKMNTKQRRESFPPDMYDVPSGNQIVYGTR